MKILSLVILFLCVFAGSAFAQGEDGSLVNKPAKTKPKKTVSTPKKAATIPKPAAKASVKPKPTAKTQRKTQAAKVVFGDLTIRVNEPDTEIFLSNAEGNVFEEQDSAMMDESGMLELNEVAAGRYVVKARKNGFFDGETVIIVKGGTNNIATVNLRAASAFLSVRTSLSDAAIQVDGVGEFQGSIENLTVNPGTYRISVHKKGYVSESRTVSLSVAGQREELVLILRGISFESKLLEAKSALNARDWRTALQTSRALLAIDPDSAGANLLAGLATFESSNPKAGVDSLARAIALGESVSLPARIYNKEKNELQLVGGNLVFGPNSLAFVSTGRADLSFSTTQAEVNEVFEKIDEFGITYISFKARGDFNGKKERRTLRLYPQPARVKASKKELACLPCTNGSCPCQNEEVAIYDLIIRWKNSRFAASVESFGITARPSDDFARFATNKFSIRVPENWKPLVQTERQILTSPSGGYITTSSGVFSYSVGIDVNVLDNPANLEHAVATKNIIQAIQSGNPYLTAERTASRKFPVGTAFMGTLKGVSPASKIEETVMVFTFMRRDGGILTVTMVCPANEVNDYEPVFARILNSLDAP